MHVGGVLGLKRISFARSNWVEHGRKCEMKFVAVEMLLRSELHGGWLRGWTVTKWNHHRWRKSRQWYVAWEAASWVLRAVCSWVLGCQRLLRGIGMAQGWWRMGAINNGQRGTADVGVVRQNPSSWVNAWWWTRLIQRLSSPALVIDVKSGLWRWQNTTIGRLWSHGWLVMLDQRRANRSKLY